jgi:hypothetical protein
MNRTAQSPNPVAPAWRMPALIGGVLAIAIIAGVLFALLSSRQPTAEQPSASPTPSAPPSPTASPSEEPSPTGTPELTPVAAPEGWTLVHTFGEGSQSWTAGEIAWGDAGFLAIGRRHEGGEGGPHIAEYSMWRSADGQTWTQVTYPSPDGGRYDAAALIGAADGSYVLHAIGFTPNAPESPLVSLRSTDGETWEPLETGLPSELFVQAVDDEGPAGYLLVGGQARTTTGAIDPTLWLSDDGLTWELVHEFSQDEHFVQIHDADGGAEGYVVTGRRIEQDESGGYERFTFASADGREWVESTAPFGPDDQTFVWDAAVTSFGGNWLATLGDRNDLITVWSSADGLEWTAGATLQGNQRSLASPGLFEEVGDELILSPGATVSLFGTPGTWASTDGTTWSPVDLGADGYAGELAIGDAVAAMTGTIPGSGETGASSGAIWIRASD